MKLSSIILLPIFIKSLIAASPVVVDSSNNEYISCYKCNNYYELDGGPKNITHKQIDSENCKQNFIVEGKKDEFTCKLTINPLYMSKKVQITQTLAKRESCPREWAETNFNVFCDDSKLCRFLSICCDDNLCNSYENYGLTKVFNNKNDDGVIENYSKYSNKSCEINDKPRSDYCIAVTNKDIYDYTVAKLNTTNTPYKLKTNLTNSEGIDDSDDLKKDEEVVVMNSKQQLDPSKKILIKMKMWIKTIDDNKDSKNTKEENEE